MARQTMTDAQRSWIELSMELDGETAEAVSEAIHPHVEGGVALEQLNFNDRPGERWEDEVASGPIILRAYLPCDETLEARRSAVERALSCLNLIRPLPAPAYREVKQSDWAEAWKAAFRPVRIGQRIVIRPSWTEVDARPGDVVVTLDPGLAFGTGLHPTTQLCALALEERIEPGLTVLDVGAGSGILSILAARLGAADVLGVDTDPEAVRAARDNVAANGVSDRVRIELGSHERAAGAYGLVAANILAGVIRQLLRDGLGRKGKLFVFSGILEAQAGEVIQALGDAGLELIERKQIADWVCLVCRRGDSPDRDRAG